MPSPGWPGTSFLIFNDCRSMKSPFLLADSDSKASEKCIRVLVVANVRLYREGMAFNLANRDGLSVVGSAASRAEVLSAVTALNPDVVVLDMAVERSLDLVRNAKEVVAGVKVIAFAVEEHDSDIVACAEAGVDGYVTPEGSMDDLTSTILSVARGELLCSPKIAAALLRRVGTLAKGVRDPPAKSDLTTREYQIAGLFEGGLSNKEIAERLHIEVSTVKNHVHNLLDKLQVTSRAEAASRIRVRSASHSRLFPPQPLSARAT